MRALYIILKWSELYEKCRKYYFSYFRTNMLSDETYYNGYHPHARVKQTAFIIDIVIHNHN